MSNYTEEDAYPSIKSLLGTEKPKFSVQVGDVFVPIWLLRRAPFTARPANAESNGWRIDDKNGVYFELGLSEALAKKRVEELNTLFAAALMVED